MQTSPTKAYKPQTGPQSCYHCGESVPVGVSYTVVINDILQPMCCPGCRAVAEMIASSGLENFYQQRSAFNQRPDIDPTESASHYALYNEPSISSNFSEQDDEGILHARLLIGGITCAACTWLIEQTLLKLPGVKLAVVNLGQSRLNVSLDSTLCPLAEVFRAVDALGYKCRPFQTSTRREQMAQEHKSGLQQLAVAGLGMMQVGMFAIALHAGDIQGIEAEYQQLLRWVSLMVATFVVVFSARSFFESAWRHLKVGALVMDLPVALAIGTAWLASAWATLSGQGQVYFDSVVMFTFFLLLGRFLERRARARDQLAWFDAESTLPESVKVRRADEWLDVARKQLQPQETILITRGAIIPVDVLVQRGTSSIDESTFNGEHLPRSVTIGDALYAGTVNIEGALEARVLGTYVDTRLAALQRSVERAQTEKPVVAQLADKIASKFVGMVLLVTAATAGAWFFIDPDKALWISLSVLVISCPCALALATPAALTGAANGLRRSGIIVRGENALEALARTTHLVFDKTGTLTQGKLTLKKTLCLSDIANNEILRIAASLQLFSNHPLANAFAEYPCDLPFEQVNYCVGKGLEAQLEHQTYRIGSQSFCAALAADMPPPPDDNFYWIALCRDATPLAWFGLEDSAREEAHSVIDRAFSYGLTVELLTGDSSSQGTELAKALHISTVHTGVSPEQKMAYVQKLQNQGAVVAMVGDGLNDAPVLGVANASFAVAGATELARTQADFILVDGDLNAVLDSYKHATKGARIIRQNLSWALLYNLCGIPLAALGYIPPWMAAVGMSASSLLVVINSLRLNKPSTIRE
ncbi:MAG: heavy metal translocating P-type ATPase [Halioglobus sp.]